MNTYNRQVAATEMDVLSPVFNAEVLVLDEFGASKPSEWVSDTVAHILNTRYNERRTTIITTNFPNLEELPKADWAKLSDTQRAVRVETLGDRIGERMRSRLQEMCLTVEMYGKDFRKSVKHAHFATDTKGPDEIKGVQSGAAIASVPPDTRIGECPIATPAPEQEDPLLGRIRTTDKKLAVAAPELRTQAEEVKNPIVPQVWVYGAPEPMITRREAFPDGPSPDEPPVGRGKMGKSATPQPKRLVDNDWRKG